MRKQRQIRRKRASWRTGRALLGVGRRGWRLTLSNPDTSAFVVPNPRPWSELPSYQQHRRYSAKCGELNSTQTPWIMGTHRRTTCIFAGFRPDARGGRSHRAGERSYN